jgi:amino acid transporter
MSMSRDGLLPKRFSKIHPRFRTPSFATIITGIIVGVPALFLNLTIVTDLTSIGTLFAFILVCGGVLMLPREESSNGRFKLPYINGQWIVPGLIIAFVLIFRAPLAAKWSFAGGWEVWKHNIPFYLFTIVAVVITVLSFTRKLSLIPVLGLLSCFYLMTEMGLKNWIVFAVWLLIGLVIYFGYSYRNSKLSKATQPASAAVPQ